MKRCGFVIVLLFIFLFNFVNAENKFDSSSYSLSHSGDFVADVSNMNQSILQNSLNSLDVGISSKIENNLLHLHIDNLTHVKRIDFVNSKVNVVDSLDAYIVEFKKPSLIEEQKGNISTENVAATNLPDLPKYQGEIIQEHSDAIKDIKNRVNNRISDLSGIGTFLGMLGFFKSITGFDILDEKQTNIGVKSEFYKSFNGVVLDNLSVKDVEKIKSSPYVKGVYLDKKVQASMMDSVPLINADDVWQMADTNGVNLTGTNVTVAIVDTGIDYTHPDLGECDYSSFIDKTCSKVIGGWNFVDGNDNPMDDNGHGTHCAGITAGTGLGGLKGVAPDAKLYAYKVLDSSGSGSVSNIISALEMAVDPNGDGNLSDHVDIISMSLGGSGNPDDALSRAVDNVDHAGVVVVVAAGNSGPSLETIGSPGTAREALTVGATYKKDYNGSEYWDTDPRVDQITEFSSRGPVIWSNGTLNKPDVVAPGALICSARLSSFEPWNINPLYAQCLDDKHVLLAGTSMATPLVAGAVALLRQKNPSLSPEEIKSLIKFSSKDLGYDINTQGSGRIDILNAVNSRVLFSGDLNFGDVQANVLSSKTIIIKNLASENISLSFSVENATSLDDDSSINVVSLDKNEIVIAPNSEIELNVSINFPLIYDGSFIGNINVIESNNTYRLPYSFQRYSILNLSFPGHYPNYYIHNLDFSNAGSASQGSDFDGDSYSFTLRRGTYVIYAINDFVDPTQPDNYPETNEYMLVEQVNISSFGEINKQFSLDNARKFVVPAVSMTGEKLFLYEWQQSVRTYKDNLRGNYFGVNFFSSFIQTSGERVVYLNNKPNNELNTDIILKYYGSP